MKQDIIMEELYILWTSPDRATAEEMVFPYARNSRLQGWWEQVTLIIWGGADKLVVENPEIQQKLAELKDHGVHLTACQACAENLGAVEILEQIGVEIKYWGTPLTEVLKSDHTLITI